MKTHINIFIPKPLTPQKKAIRKELKSLEADHNWIEIIQLFIYIGYTQLWYSSLLYVYPKQFKILQIFFQKPPSSMSGLGLGIVLGTRRNFSSSMKTIVFEIHHFEKTMKISSHTFGTMLRPRRRRNFLLKDEKFC